MILRSPYRLFISLCLISVLVWWKAILDAVSLALRNDAYTYILLIVPVSALLIVAQWRSSRWQPVNGEPMGLLLLLAGAVAAAAGWWAASAHILAADTKLTVEIFGLVTWWIGAFLLSFGRQLFRNSLFALAFLLLAIPLPQVAVDRVIVLLVQGTALCARGMLALAGVPVTQHGSLLSMPGLTVEIAQECSSIRSSTFLLVSALVMSYALLRSFASRMSIVLLAVVLAVLKNGVRVFTLTMLARKVDPGIFDGRLHHEGGVVFFAAALAVLFAAIMIERRFSGSSIGRASDYSAG